MKKLWPAFLLTALCSFLVGALWALPLQPAVAQMAEHIFKGKVIIGTAVVTNKMELATGATFTLPADALSTASVTADDLAPDSVSTSEIATDGVGSAEIAADAVGTSEIATDGVGAAEIAASAVGTSEVNDGTLAPADLTAAAKKHSLVIPVEDLAADGDIAERAEFIVPFAATITKVSVVNKASAAVGLDASNSCAILLKVGATTKATETYDDAPTFPNANTASAALTISSAGLAANDILTLTVTQGTNANVGPFLVVIEYTAD